MLLFPFLLAVYLLSAAVVVVVVVSLGVLVLSVVLWTSLMIALRRTNP